MDEHTRLMLQAAAKMELKRRLEEEPLRYFQRPRVHVKQREVLSRPERFIGVLGGNRTGKTTVGAIMCVLKALGSHAEPYVQSWRPEDQEWWYRIYGNYTPTPRDRVWAATVNWDVHRDVLQPTLLEWLPRAEIEDIGWRKKGVMDYIELKHGATITFKSYETGAQGFQGAKLRHVWLDEEPDYDIWNECEKRVMDLKGSITLTFTPLSGITWSHDRIYLNTTQDPETWSVHLTWEDNPYLDDGEKKRLLASMDPNEIEARVHGRYLVPGTSVFFQPNLMKRRGEVKRGTLVPIPNAGSGQVEVWEKPQPGVRYIIGIDTAEGLASGDNSVACVGRADTGLQVAELVCREEPAVFAELVMRLGQYYNDAFLVPERNNHGMVVIAYLNEHLYPMLYRHRDDKRWGWPSNAKTRPMLISYAQEVVRDSPELIQSPGLIEEMLTFVRNARGRPEAAGKGTRGGKKDDRVFAFALMLAGRDFFGEVAPPVRPRRPLSYPSHDPDVHPSELEDRHKEMIRQHTVTFNPDYFVDPSEFYGQ